MTKKFFLLHSGLKNHFARNNSSDTFFK